MLKCSTDANGDVQDSKGANYDINIRDENLPRILEKLPALKNPTIAKLTGKGSEGWSAINTVIPREDFIKMIPVFRKFAQGLVVFEPRQILPLEKYKNDSD